MKQPRTQIAAYLADKTLQKGASPKFVKEIAAYLLSEHRAGELASLMRDVQADWATSGYVEVTAYSAHPLDAAAKRDITRQVKVLYPNAKHIIITERQDPEVIGGVRVSLPDRQFDLTIESKLRTFKQLAIAGKD